MGDIKIVYNEQNDCFVPLDDSLTLTITFETHEQMDHVIQILKEAFENGRV